MDGAARPRFVWACGSNRPARIGLIGLRCIDVHLIAGAHISCTGKGRKLRITPLTSGTVAILRVWLAERAGNPTVITLYKLSLTLGVNHFDLVRPDGEDG